jgi:hypothetical protein
MKVTRKTSKKKLPKKRVPKTPGSAEKRALISKTILKVLGARVVRWGDLADQVSAAFVRVSGLGGSLCGAVSGGS